MDALAPHDDSAQHGLRQHLGLFDATMIVAGSMIGSGIFIVSASIARDVGSAGWLLLTWGLAGFITILGALSYAELAAMMPQAGGQYVYLREAYSPMWGFFFGWTSFLVIQTGFIAAVSVAFAKFLGVLVPALGTDQILWETPLQLDLAVQLPWMDEPVSFFRRERFQISAGQFVALGVVLVLTAINCLGVRAGKAIQNIFTVTKMTALGLLIAVGCTIAFDPRAAQDNFAAPWTGLAEGDAFAQASKLAPWGFLAGAMVIGGAMVGALFSADAWNNVTFTAGETRHPQRNLPLSLALGTGLVIALYLLANIAYLAALPLQGSPQAATPFERGIAFARDDRVGTAILEQVSPRLGVRLMAVAIMISTFGCVNGIILTAARLFYAMARDGLFFQSVGQLSGNGVPRVALVLQAAWSVVLIFSGTYGDLLDYVIFATLFFYVLTVAGVFVLRRTWPHAPRPYRALGYPVVPALYIVLCTLIMVDLLIVKPVYSWPSFLIILSGLPVYFLWRKNAPGTAR